MGSLRPGRVGSALRDRYEGSLAQDLMKALRAAEFGNRIILFGAAMLLSVLPMIILLSALASSRVDDDISQHLGLSNQGSRIVSGLFRTSSASVSPAVLLSLVLSLAGTIAVARSVQVIYEQAFEQSNGPGVRNLLRCAVWVAGVAGLLIADAAMGRALRDGPAGPVVLGLVEFAALALFFWWTLHFLLGGREPWRRVGPSAIATALFWIGLGVFASFYFSSTIVSDSRLYGTIGVVFSLMTWFIAIGAVITLGAVVGVVWEQRSNARHHRIKGGSRRDGRHDTSVREGNRPDPAN
jgi:membrane protein